MSGSQFKDEKAPCESCPWTTKGQPDLTPAIRQAAVRGAWFCCHVHLGTCYGAKRYGAAKQAKGAQPMFGPRLGS
jgi:hypothetical protein